MTENDETSAAEASLTEAARAVDEELDVFEGFASSLDGVNLDSEQALSSAGRTLAAAVACHARLAARLRALGGSIAHAQERQQRATAVIETSARHVQKRSTEFAELASGLAALGDEARQITGLLQGLMPRADEPATSRLPDFAARLRSVGDRMELAVQRAQELAERAAERGMVDIASQAKSLKEQLATARTQLLASGKSTAPV